MLQVPEEDIDRITQAVYRLRKGRMPNPITLPEGYPANEVSQLTGYVNALIADQTALAAFAAALSRGDLDAEPPAGSGAVVQALKNLHANLRHLTWKTEQIARGDFSQQVDFMGGFSEAFNSMTRQLSEASASIMAEKEKTEALLLNILPAHIAEELKETGSTVPELFENVTVFFSDLVGFTNTSSRLDPHTLIAELNDIFTHFDNIAEAHHCERIKTIGDAYLAVCGMPLPDADHARNMVRAAVEMVRWLEARNMGATERWLMRVGIHTGPVVGAVVGIKKYIYDVFGDTINTASRMESSSEPMRINLSEITHRLVRDEFAFVGRPALEVKGKGPMRMYFVETDG